MVLANHGLCIKLSNKYSSPGRVSFSPGHNSHCNAISAMVYWLDTLSYEWLIQLICGDTMC